MQVLGIGPLELFFILVIALLVLGPRGMVDTARQGGKVLRNLVRSPIWKDVVDTSREIRNIPSKIAREAGVEKELDMLRRAASGDLPIDDIHLREYSNADDNFQTKIHDVIPDKADKNNAESEES